MNEHDDIPKEQLSHLIEYTRRQQHVTPLRERVGVHRSIESARSTLLINLVIEIVSGLILFVGIAYTAKFLIDRRAYIEPGRLRLYLEILTFFSVGWFTYVSFKIRAKYRALKKANSPEPPKPED